jgi:hypothetical protein
MVALAVLGLAGCDFGFAAPNAHGPQWIERPASTLVSKMGAPDWKVPLPKPSLSTVYAYNAGAVPGAAICERDYFVRGDAVIGYREHGAAANCTRSAGRTE